MRPYKYLFWHCTWTPEGREVTKEDIMEWHTGPRNLPGGVQYMGEIYPNRAALPDVTINGKPIRDIHGRGWNRPGYSAMFHLNGSVEVLNHWNEDAWIDDHEITNGVAGMNSRSRHFVYVGGCDAKMRKKDTRTPEQHLAMEVFTYDQMRLHPGVLILGHNEASSKACPSFSVPEWLREMGVPEANIYALHKK